MNARGDLPNAVEALLDRCKHAEHARAQHLTKRTPSTPHVCAELAAPMADHTTASATPPQLGLSYPGCFADPPENESWKEIGKTSSQKPGPPRATLDLGDCSRTAGGPQRPPGAGRSASRCRPTNWVRTRSGKL